MTILIYDVHASESGALAILDDLYCQIINEKDKSIRWVFAVSTPKYQEAENIVVLRYPWVKKSWSHRLYFNEITTRTIVKKYKPDKIFSLQNEGINFCKIFQTVYLHLPFVLTDYKFKINRDGKRLWLYQNILSKKIFASLRKVDKVIVQTEWMKKTLHEKGKIDSKKIVIAAPDISLNKIGTFQDIMKNRNRFFYPATAFSYKNHMIILRACAYLEKLGYSGYEVRFTLKGDENNYALELYRFSQKNNLNVVFGGAISREKVFKTYTDSVLLFPSFVESFGLPLLEARLSKTFILASRTPFSEEILTGYNNAAFFESDDYKKLATLMLEIMNGKTIYYNVDESDIRYQNASLIDFII